MKEKPILEEPDKIWFGEDHTNCSIKHVHYHMKKGEGALLIAFGIAVATIVIGMIISAVIIKLV